MTTDNIHKQLGQKSFFAHTVSLTHVKYFPSLLGFHLHIANLQVSPGFTLKFFNWLKMCLQKLQTQKRNRKYNIKWDERTLAIARWKFWHCHGNRFNDFIL